MFILDFLKNNKKFIQTIIIKNVPTAESNKAFYDSKDVVNLFIPYSNLQKPEETILSELRNKLSNMKMLDIGVGAGRTTIHFASVAEEYIGIDCASNMIEAAKKRFQDFPKSVSFLTSDADDMRLFKDNYFDFVLFSWCGLDYVDHASRLKILTEIQRVLKIGGLFAFQTHNLNYQTKNCSIQLSRYPSILLARINHLLQLRFLNERGVWKTIRNSSEKKQYVLFRDETHNFRMITYIISPAEQIKQLASLGFSSTRVFDLQNGKEIENPAEAMDPWLYFISSKVA